MPTIVIGQKKEWPQFNQRKQKKCGSLEVPEYWFSTFIHNLLHLRKYGKACELHYTLHYLKGFFLSLCTVIMTVFWYKISLKTCFKGCTFCKFPGGAWPQTPLDRVRAHTPMKDIVWPDQTKFACSGPAAPASSPGIAYQTHSEHLPSL